MNATSSEAYRSIREHLQPMEKRVLDAMQNVPRTREEIAELTGMRLSSVCGRIASLRKAGRVESWGTATHPDTGKRHELLIQVQPCPE